VLLDELTAALSTVPEHDWLTGAVARVRTDPGAAPRLFARAGRTLGRAPLPDHPQWTAGRAGRVLLLAALAEAPDGADRIVALYQQGDPAERLAILQAMPLLAIGPAARFVPQDALRTNDARLVAAAMGPYARHLDDATWRQGVIKCVFMGIPLTAVDGLEERADGDLAVMLAGLVDERRAAGRTVPADALALLDRLTSRSDRSPR
jgi:hypothetical protein